MAQLAEQFTRNEQVVGSTPTISSNIAYMANFFKITKDKQYAPF